MSIEPASFIDYDQLMQANLSRVFSERDVVRRIAAIHELYAEDAVLYEPETSARGHTAINTAVSRLLSSLPPDFIFTASGPASGHHGTGRLRWQAGPASGAIAVRGMDIAHIQDGRIHSLHVFLEPIA
ncbi:MAG: nuclear transport factor 2 family protein [Rhizobium sp.]|nr:MAG: nuclear transport factor 2 family protein [Rhizobium sp.]